MCVSSPNKKKINHIFTCLSQSNVSRPFTRLEKSLIIVEARKHINDERDENSTTLTLQNYQLEL
jgi:hypothetical protein